MLLNVYTGTVAQMSIQVRKYTAFFEKGHEKGKLKFTGGKTNGTTHTLKEIMMYAKTYSYHSTL